MTLGAPPRSLGGLGRGRHQGHGRYVQKEFNRAHLKGLYPNQVLTESNDVGFIDVGLLSKLTVGAVTSFQTAVLRPNPGLDPSLQGPGGRTPLRTIP